MNNDDFKRITILKIDTTRAKIDKFNASRLFFRASFTHFLASSTF